MSAKPSPFPPSSGAPAGQSRGWCAARLILLASAILATLLAVFYAEENWRGRRAWEQCRRELEAKGEVLEWSAYIPPPVADDQNVFKAPHMQEWFVKNSRRSGFSNQPTGPVGHTLGTVPLRGKSRAERVLLAEVSAVGPDTRLDSFKADTVLRFEELGIKEQARKLVQRAIGPGVIGPLEQPIAAHPLDQLKPLQVVLQMDIAPTVEQIAELFPNTAAAPLARPSGQMQVEAAGSNSFRVWLAPQPYIVAPEFLESSEPLQPDFDLIRQALTRPCARMEGDYRQPWAIPIPNFVAVRSVAQALAQRAQCHLLLGQPELALEELTLFHELSGVLRGKPRTLVSAMIEVALAGLYAEVVADGLRLGAWREPQLVALQAQLAETDLIPHVKQALQLERMNSFHLLTTYTPGEVADLFSSFSAISGTNRWERLWKRIRESRCLLISLAPRGWLYQNARTAAFLRQTLVESVDLTNRLVQPGKVEAMTRQTEETFRGFSPYTFLVAVTVPNFSKAFQTVARNQTMVHEGLLACALERYCLAVGQYPETLEALVPRFVTKLPHEIVNGEPLNYRRTDNRGFILYSVGWNEKDDGGVADKSLTAGDWVWQAQEGQPGRQNVGK